MPNYSQQINLTSSVLYDIIYYYNIIIGDNMIILGIDPGIAIVGWGVIVTDASGMRQKPLDFGAVTTPSSMNTEDRLLTVYSEISAIIKKYKPDSASIEELFFNTNQKTGIIVAEARGVIVLALRQNGVPIYEYTPLQIKNTVTGYGRADKNQMIDTVTLLLGLKEKPKPDDTADALAAAMCHAYTGVSRLAQYYNKPTTMAGKIGQTGKGSRSDIARKLIDN